jgi:predicted DNA-binding protein
MKRIHIHLTKRQIERLQELSEKLGGLPVAEIIRRAIDEYLDRNKMGWW